MNSFESVPSKLGSAMLKHETVIRSLINVPFDTQQRMGKPLPEIEKSKAEKYQGDKMEEQEELLVHMGEAAEISKLHPL